MYEEVKPTPRQLLWLQHIANGSTYKEIGYIFDVSPSTIKNTIRNLRMRIKAKSTCQAVAIGIRKGWII